MVTPVQPFRHLAYMSNSPFDAFRMSTNNSSTFKLSQFDQFHDIHSFTKFAQTATKKIDSFGNKSRLIKIDSNSEKFTNVLNSARWKWSCHIDGEFHHGTVVLPEPTEWMFGFVIRWRHIVRYNIRWVVIGRWANVFIILKHRFDWNESGCASYHAKQCEFVITKKWIVVCSLADKDKQTYIFRLFQFQLVGRKGDRKSNNKNKKQLFVHRERVQCACEWN